MAEYVVARSDELTDGDRILRDVAGREIAVFQLDGEYYAYLNWCAHQGGPCCEGNLTGTFLPVEDADDESDNGPPSLEWTREGEILNCPWHGWEYDIRSGECLSRRGVTLPSFPVESREDEIVVRL
ncbi:MAG: Rieske (2Fe-2S) protein [Halobacteriales archaeon]